MEHIEIWTTAPKNMRYATVGDWRKAEDIISQGNYDAQIIEISEMGNEDSEFLIAVHELVEWYLCKKVGITEQEVDEFDMSELAQNLDDPGMDKFAPYHAQHVIATSIEMMLASVLKINWAEHNELCDETYEKVKEAKNGTSNTSS